MENEKTNVNENVENANSDPKFGAANFQVPMDVGDGSSSGADSAFGSSVSDDQSFNEYGPSDRETLSFTQMGSIYLTPADTTAGQPVAGDPGEGFSDEEGPFSKLFDYNKAHPISCFRGTNMLIPFGAHTFIKEMGTTNITDIGALTALTTKMNGLSPSFRSAGSYREIVNWKRIFDLKNVVISYFNRSIPFTDLEPSDRFALEMCYVRDLMLAAMPIYAKSAAMALVKHEQSAGYQYAAELLTNLNSLTCERIMKQIYSAIAELPAIDEVIFKRAAEFSRLHTSSKASGFTPVIIGQDWTVASPSRYRLDNVKMGANSGYVVNTKLNSAITSQVVMNGTSFMEWVEMWLRADLISEDLLASTLEQFANIAQSIRTNYSIMLGCAAQLEQKGAVKYTSVSAFLPVTGITPYYLDYKCEAPTFSYTFKERFEYAPRQVTFEVGTATGNNRTARFNLAEIRDSYSAMSTFARPVGLYKGEKAWGTKEVVGIGVFKVSTMAPENQYTIKQLFAQAFATPLSPSSATLGTDGSPLFEDAYYGDIYSAALAHVDVVNATGAITYANSAHELIRWYGVYRNAPMAAPFATIGSWYHQATTAQRTVPYSVVAGASILDYSTLQLSGTESHALRLIPNIMQILTQLDLTFYASGAANVSGRRRTPIVIFNGYRGCQWDVFDITPIENAAADSYRSMAVGLKPRAKSV